MGYHSYEPDDEERAARWEKAYHYLLRKLRKVEAERDELQAKLEWALGGGEDE